MKNAFPEAYNDTKDGKPITKYREGMTLFEYYVGQALAGLCANPKITEQKKTGEITDLAVIIAHDTTISLKEAGI